MREKWKPWAAVSQLPLCFKMVNPLPRSRNKVIPLIAQKFPKDSQGEAVLQDTAESILNQPSQTSFGTGLTEINSLISFLCSPSKISGIIDFHTHFVSALDEE